MERSLSTVPPGLLGCVCDTPWELCLGRSVKGRDRAFFRIADHSLGLLWGGHPCRGSWTLQGATCNACSAQWGREEPPPSWRVSYADHRRPWPKEGKPLFVLGCCQFTPKPMNLGRPTVSHTRSVNLCPWGSDSPAHFIDGKLSTRPRVEQLDSSPAWLCPIFPIRPHHLSCVCVGGGYSLSPR